MTRNELRATADTVRRVQTAEDRERFVREMTSLVTGAAKAGRHSLTYVMTSSTDPSNLVPRWVGLDKLKEWVTRIMREAFPTLSVSFADGPYPILTVSWE